MRGGKVRERCRLVHKGSPSGAHLFAEIYLAFQDIVKE